MRKPKLSPTQKAFAEEVLKPYLEEREIRVQKTVFSIDDRLAMLERRLERVIDIVERAGLVKNGKHI